MTEFLSEPGNGVISALSDRSSSEAGPSGPKGLTATKEAEKPLKPTVSSDRKRTKSASFSEMISGGFC